ncbi:hypothetical protein G6011_02200 [Alternaria panax]|uniref:Uncharacterized protein n=1 Tax=Alternaria panax TaxID=48097 RepID=A0AAD4I780_9PLEO|nr:hypothetical protein G6011_02200 [Alternaria panax]
MPSFQRFKHPFRRPTHYYTIHEPSPTPRQLDEQREKERRRARDKIEDDLDDGRIGSRGGDSPDELPVIIDRGPYRGHVYPREQLFFNSIMTASDVEPIYAGPPGGELRQEVHRAPVRRPRIQGEQKSPSRPVPSEYLTASQNAENLRRWLERNKTDAVGRTQHPRPVLSEHLTAKQNAEDLRRWEGHNGRTRTAPQEQVPVRIPSPFRHPSPPRGPITPGTREWDGFMDFPLESYVHVDAITEVTVNAADPVHILPTTSTPAAPPHPTAAPESASDSLSQTDPFFTPAQSILPQTQAGVNPSTRLPSRLSTRTEQPEQLTWNSALNSILRNEAVDPAMRARVRERVERSLTAFGPSLCDRVSHPVAVVDAGLVSNFSYPIAGSYYPSPSSDHSDDSSNDPRHHPPSPPDRVPEHVFILLCSLLTPSELALHYRVIQDSAPPHAPPFPDLVPPSNVVSNTPVEVRLIQKLHTAVYGLQDRVLGVEEDLIPELSTNLENKHLQVRELDLENRSLQDEVTELKRILKFSNKVLAGCWEREWEIWRTLLDIKRGREMCRSPWARMFSRTSDTYTRDDGLLDYHKPEDYVAQPRQSGRVAQSPLKKKGLDALLLLAKQNVGIIVEDLGEMTVLVEAFQERNEVEVEVQPTEGFRSNT